MARRRRHEEHQNHEAWAIPYGDLITLLLAFFVVMYSISSVNAGKYRVLSNALNAAFRGTEAQTPVNLGGSPSGVTEQMPMQAIQQIFGVPSQEKLPLPQAHGNETNGDPRPSGADPRDTAGNAHESSERSQPTGLAAVESGVSAALAQQIADKSVQVQRRGGAVEVRISADILFASGQAEPTAKAVPVLQRLADALKAFPNGVRVEGHTDNVPVRGGAFRSNWELSGARAGAVVRLFTERGIDPQRLAVVGFGEYRPVQANENPVGRNANRRVAILVLGANQVPDSSQIR